jgi:hypothetical protein
MDFSFVPRMYSFSTKKPLIFNNIYTEEAVLWRLLEAHGERDRPVSQYTEAFNPQNNLLSNSFALWDAFVIVHHPRLRDLIIFGRGTVPAESLLSIDQLKGPYADRLPSYVYPTSLLTNGDPQVLLHQYSVWSLNLVSQRLVVDEFVCCRVFCVHCHGTEYGHCIFARLSVKNILVRCVESAWPHRLLDVYGRAVLLWRCRFALSHRLFQASIGNDGANNPWDSLLNFKSLVSTLSQLFSMTY